MVIWYNDIMQNYHKNYPPKRVRVTYPQIVLTKNAQLPSMSVSQVKND